MSELSEKLKRGVKHPQQITQLIEENENLTREIELLRVDIDMLYEAIDIWQERVRELECGDVTPDHRRIQHD